MRDRFRKKFPAVPPEEEALLARLEASLSDGELRRVLAGALLELDEMTWGAFPFLRSVTALSFLEAGPAGASAGPES